MGRIGFWQLLLDDRVSYWEAQRINSAYDAADIAQGVAEAAQSKSYSNETRISNLGREIVFLRTALTVLVKTLKDGNVLDERLLDARLEAAMEEAAASLPKLPTGPTSMNEVLHQNLASPVTTKLTCVRCRNQVAASSTLMTGDGPMCERCPV